MVSRSAPLLLAIGMLLVPSYATVQQTEPSRPRLRTETERSDAVAGLQERAERGDADAQFELGFVYFTGEGVIQNYVEAVRWTRLAAEQGHAAAQSNLGEAYANGEGVIQNYVEAVRWTRLAADQGIVEAQTNLGEELQELAEQGYAGAQFYLGVIYSNGDGVTEDYVRAYMWFNLAAAQGSENGRAMRDRVENEMTSQQIAEAQARASRCVESNYSECD